MVKRFRKRRQKRLDARHFDNRMTRFYGIAIDMGIPNAEELEPRELIEALEAEMGISYDRLIKWGEQVDGAEEEHQLFSNGKNSLDKKGFRNKQARNNHWNGDGVKQVKRREDYAKDGIYTVEQYEKRAVDLLESACDENVRGYINSKGQIIRYDKKKNDFVMGTKEKGVFTMFKPEDGYEYYLKQLRGDIENETRG